MTMPKFKPTKWKVEYCMECKCAFPSYWRCGERHPEKIVERDNVPFFVPDMKVKRFGPKWATLHSSKLRESFPISSSKMASVIMICGVEPGGHIPNQWWMWANVGGSKTLMWVPSE